MLLKDNFSDSDDDQEPEIKLSVQSIG